MTERNDKHDQALWEILGRDEAPEPDRPLWPDVRRRTLGRRHGVWLPRLSLAGAGALCTAAGLWLGLALGDGGPTAASSTDTMVSGSLLDDGAWTLDALYLAAGDAAADDGSTR